MHWADYRDGSKKAKARLGFDVNHSIPTKIFLTTGKGDERPFVSKILSPGQTGIMDRYYQCHKDFDLWQTEGKHFVCRIRRNTHKTVIKTSPVSSNSNVFYDATVLLGTPNAIRQRPRFVLLDTVLMAKSIGLLQTDTTSPLKKLHIFTNFAGI